jgi:hypothetical protein
MLRLKKTSVFPNHLASLMRDISLFGNKLAVFGVYI